VTAIPVDLKLMLRNIHDEPALEFDAIKIDRARREVHTSAGHTLLTKGEFDLLTFLAENPGVAFSRKDLIDGCRGGDHVLDYRAIDVQIFGLRKKLGEARWHIQTVRGFGYRFVVDRPEHEIVTLRPR
jgi:two-component system phosphate regulon response regulator PhoB